MKRFNILVAVLMVLFANQIVVGQKKDAIVENTYYGKSFDSKKVTDTNSDIYKKITATDTITTQLVGDINEVCQAKGCWMKVNLSTNEEVFVKFKDYGFFVPLDASGKKVMMNGKAFVEELSIADQKHYARDKGASKEEIDKIIEPKKTLRFEADGVLIHK